MTFQQVQRFLLNFGIIPDHVSHSIPLHRYAKMILTAQRWYGMVFAQWLQDCFLPMGPPIHMGFEDSATHYLIFATSWEQLEREWLPELQLLTPSSHPTLFEALS